MIQSRIRTIPDYPKPGVQFRDITTLLQDPIGLCLTIEQMVEPYKTSQIDKVVAIEARGFILGGAVAFALDAGLVAVRKQGKLPHQTLGEDYSLEYGINRIEVHADAISEGERILLIDDVIATGGTALATTALVRRMGGKIIGCGFIIDLPEFGGAERLREQGLQVTTLCSF